MFKILVIFNKYKDIFDNFINSLYIKSLIKSNLIKKRLYNIIFSFKNSLIKIKSKLNKDFLNKL